MAGPGGFSKDWRTETLPRLGNCTCSCSLLLSAWCLLTLSPMLDKPTYCRVGRMRLSGFKDLAHFHPHAEDINAHITEFCSAPLVSTGTAIVMALVAMALHPRLCSQWKKAPPSLGTPVLGAGGAQCVLGGAGYHILCAYGACGQGCSHISQRMTLRQLLLTTLRQTAVSLLLGRAHVLSRDSKPLALATLLHSGVSRATWEFTI